MSQKDPLIVQGIMISEAAQIVENAFRSVLGMNDEQLAKLSPDDKIKKYSDGHRLRAMLVYIHGNTNGGLPSMTPPRTILFDAFSGITIDSNIRLIIRRVSDFAFYYATL